MSSEFTLREINGDLFAAPEEYALAHCVAADLRMGAGIAIKFRDTFKQVQQLKDQKVQPGGVAVLKHQSRFIYYLVTKSSTYQKPTYRDLYLSLQAMKEHMKSNGVFKLAVPRIGCGLDGLVWDKVKDQLHEVFAGEPIEIVVYNFVPKK